VEIKYKPWHSLHGYHECLSVYLNDNAFVEAFIYEKRKMDIFFSFLFSKERIPILGKQYIPHGFFSLEELLVISSPSPF
jgi:hypothetical protein